MPILGRLRAASQELHQLHAGVLPVEARRAGLALSAAVIYTAEHWAKPDVQGSAIVAVDIEANVPTVPEHVQDHAAGRSPDLCQPHPQPDLAYKNAGHLDHGRLHRSAELPRDRYFRMLQRKLAQQGDHKVPAVAPRAVPAAAVRRDIQPDKATDHEIRPVLTAAALLAVHGALLCHDDI